MQILKGLTRVECGWQGGVMNRRKKKNAKFQQTKLEKSIRRLRKKKRGYITAGLSENKTEIKLEVYDFLKDKKFDDIEYRKRLLVRNGGTIQLTIPVIFSIMLNPDETIDMLRRIFYYCINPNVNHIIFNHKDCVELEIAASTIMDTIVLAANTYRKKNGTELIVSGSYPRNDKARKILVASGLVEHLNIKNKDFVRTDNLLLFKLANGKSGLRQSGTIATRITDYYNECLHTQHYQLTEDGKCYLANMFGEIVDNCEIHGGEHAVWYALGHYHEYQDNDYGELQLVIFNYGDTIYEQMISEQTSVETREKINYMIERHRKFFDATWTEEEMLTVFSLQEGISRLTDSATIGYKNRGKGTVILMDKFNKIGKTVNDEKPMFSLTSGRTHIVFDNNYKLERKHIADEVLGTGEKRIIAFNADNDIFQRADRRNVQRIKEYFPGTIISMKVYVDSKYLTKLKGNKHE